MNIMFRKIIYTVLIFSILLLFLISCLPRIKEPDYTAMSFEELEKKAEKTTIYFYMWGGDARINSWVDNFVSASLKEKYDITLVRIAMDAPVFINKLLAEKITGREKGSIDLLWINGENFKKAMEEGLLYGPFSHILPNIELTDPDSTAFDFGYPVNGFEVPYGRAQFVFEYDSEKITQPPDSVEKLISWVKENPGRFTYPQPPDFTGSAFIRHLFYHAAGGHEQFMGQFDRDLYEKTLPEFRKILKEIKPYLWREGKSYPADKARLDLLFEQGEIDFNMSYTQSGAQGRIIDGRYPQTVRTFVFKSGSLSNMHFTAVPFNAFNKPGAIIVSNFLLSPEAQLSKNKPENWGDFTVLDLNKLTDDKKLLFENLDLGEATLPVDILNRYAVPEILPEYVEEMTGDWAGIVLGRD